MAKLTVFLSSTSKDLGPFRERILAALRKSDVFEVRAMEDFGSRDAWPKDYCLEAVRRSDIFVCILGHLYGFIPEGEAVSMTEQEYLAAVAAEKPRLIWVLPDEASVPANLLKADRNLVKQDEFRERVLKDRIVDKNWSTPEQLTTSILTALQNHPLARRSEVDDHQAELEGTIDLRRYAERCLRKWRRVDLSTLANPGTLDEDVRPELSQVFIPQNVRMSRPVTTVPHDYLESQRLPDEDEASREHVRQRWQATTPRPVLEVVADETAGQLVLLGDPGAGKSSLARYILLQVLQSEGDTAEPLHQGLGGRLPLLVELRDLVAREAEAKCRDIVSYLGYLGRVEGFGFDGPALEAHLASKPSLIILDGLDEIFDIQRRKAMVGEIVGLAVRFRSARVLVTSRIAGFDAHPFEAGGFTIATLVDLSDAQVEAFASGWFSLAFPAEPERAEAARQDLLGALARRPQLRSIAGNPMLLTIMAVVARHKRLARSRSSLYRQALEVLCYAWDNRRGLKLPPDSPLADLQAEGTLLMLRRVAWHMQEGEGLRANAMAAADLRQILQRFFADEWQFPPPKASRAARETMQLLEERSWVVTPRGPGLFGFVHRTFLEYLCALELAERFHAREIQVEVLRDEFLLPRLHDDAWKEVIRLLMGLLPPAQADGLIQTICPRPEEARNNGERLGVASQCIAEIDPKHVGKAAASCEALTGALYEWIIPRDTQAGAAEIADGLRALEPGCWPTRVLASRGLPTHSVQWWPTYGDCFMASHYERVFPALCDAIFVHEPGAFDVLCAQVAHNSSVDPFTRTTLIDVVSRHFADRARTAEVLLGLATERSMGGIPSHKECDDYRQEARRAATHAFGALGARDREATFATLRGLAKEAPFWEVREEALSGLSSHFPERDGTRRALWEAIDLDVDPLVREAAVKKLASLPHKADELFTELFRLVSDDRPSEVRRATLGELAASWGHREDVLQTLRQRTVEDESAEVRRTALDLLARAVPEATSTGDLLYDRCESDSDAAVRDAALRQVGRIWPRDEETLTFIRGRLAVDESAAVRRTAVRLLGDFFADPLARRLVQERARADESPDVRREALYQWVSRVLSPPERALFLALDPYSRAPDSRTPVSSKAALEAAAATHATEEDTRAELERIVDEYGLPLTLEWRGKR